MILLATPRIRRGLAPRAAATVLLALLAVGPAAAFVEAPAPNAQSDDLIRQAWQAPSGANVIGRGIGGLHGALRSAHDDSRPSRVVR